MIIEELLNKIYTSKKLAKEDLISILKLEDQNVLDKLYSFADRVRAEHCGNGVLLRGIVEISNECDNTCLYCGLNKYNKQLQRYTMSSEEIMASVKMIAESGIKTIVIQSGEAEAFSPVEIEDLLKGIKKLYPEIAITLSLGRI